MSSLTKKHVFSACGRPNTEAINYLKFELDYDSELADQLPQLEDDLVSKVGAAIKYWQESIDEQLKPLPPTKTQQIIIDDIVNSAAKVFAKCDLVFRSFDATKDLYILATDDFRKIYKSEDPLKMAKGFVHYGKIFIDGSLEDNEFSWIFAHEFTHFQCGSRLACKVLAGKLKVYGFSSGFDSFIDGCNSYKRLNEGATEFFGFIFRSVYFDDLANKPWHGLRMTEDSEPFYVYDILRADNGSLSFEKIARLLKAYLDGDYSIWTELIPNDDLRNELINSKDSVQSAEIIKRHADPRFQAQHIYKKYGL